MSYLAALIALGCTYADARPLVTPIQQAAKRYNIDPLLMVAVVAHESQCKNVVARGRGKGKRGCDVGAFQIHVPGCDKRAVRRLMTSRATAALTSAKILSWGRIRCRRAVRPWYCAKGWWFGSYNSGSRRWAAAVAAKWRVLRSRYRLPVL